MLRQNLGWAMHSRPDKGPPAELVLDRGFDAETLRPLRTAVREEARASGMPEDGTVEVMLAVHELAANAVRHGAGSGLLRMWAGMGRLYCQVSDGSPSDLGRADDIARPVTGKDEGVTNPWPYRQGHGLWLVRNAADQMSVVSGPDGSRVTVMFTFTTRDGIRERQVQTTVRSS